MYRTRASRMVYPAGTNGTRLIFDDFETEESEDGKVFAWAEMCPSCKRKWLGVLGQNRFDDGSAMGTCSVQGCESEADSYVDFKICEVGFLW